jgi:hypothetical protein
MERRNRRRWEAKMMSPVDLDLDCPRAPQAQRRVVRRAIALAAARPASTDVSADGAVAAAIVLAIAVAAASALPFFAAL